MRIGVWVTLANDRGATLVDREDYDAVVAAGGWNLNDRGYVRREAWAGGRRRVVKLHRFIWELRGERAPRSIDHINRDPLDNRRSNLRAATVRENNCNVGRRRDNSSGIKGVYFCVRIQRWRARISVHGQTRHLGSFATAAEAAAAYSFAAREYHGEFACLTPVPTSDSVGTR